MAVWELSSITGPASSIRSAAHSKSSAAQRVTDRVGPQTVLLVPLARPPVQGGQLIGLLLEQVRLQDVGEEVVIAIPLTLVIERDDEQVAALQGSSISLPSSAR